MSAKRQATTELNHDNWDQEDSKEPEDTEGFKMAPKEVLEKRVIRTAKRRSNMSTNDGQKSVFGSFGGFNKAQKTSFDFLANLTNGNKANTSLSSPSIQEGSSSLFTSKSYTSTASSGGFTSLGTSTTVPSLSPSTNQSSLFSQSTSATSPTGIKFPLTGTKSDTKVNQIENPFKIQATSASPSTLSFTTKNNSTSGPITQTSSNLFVGPATYSPTAFAKSSPFKTSPTTSKLSMSPTKNDKTIEKKDSSPKKESSGDKNDDDEKKLKYYKNIQGLNVSVSDWIKKHVEETPLCILTPIFKDYEKHLKEIQDEYFNYKESKPNGEKGDFKQNLMTNNDTKTTPALTGSSLFTNSSTPPTVNTLTPENTKNISFGISPNNTQATGSVGFPFGNVSKAPSSTIPSISNQTSKPSSGFSFGIVSTTTSTSGLPSITTTKAGFSFGMNSTSQTSSSLAADATITSTNCSSTFSFGVGKPFSFNSNIQQKEESNEKNSNEDADEPPKVEFTPLVEENSVFDKKCKVFFKKDGNFVDKGVSTLYIKKIEDTGKHQLLVRANTSLGNILLNLVLSSSIPTQRMGKNNVMLVCIPTPDVKPPPTPVLIRVKTSEEADDLLEILNKYKT